MFSKMEGIQESEDKWKYVIVLSKFIVQFVEVATMKSLGVLIPTMLIVFSTDASSLGLVCSMPTAVMLFGSLPVAYVLKSSCVSVRVMAVIGAILASSGIIIAGYLTSVTALGFCLALTGFGLSMGYLPTKVLLNDYFQGRFVLMNAIGNLGSTAGALLVPVIIERALDAYGFSGSMLILGGISMHAIAASCALRSARTGKRGYQKSTKTQKQGNSWEEPLIDPDDDGDGEDLMMTTMDEERYRSDDVSSSRATSKNREDRGWTVRLYRWLRDSIIIREPLLLISLPCLFFASVVVQSWILFLVPRAVWHGIPISRAVLLSSIAGGGGILGRILCVTVLFFQFDFIFFFLIVGIVSSTTFLFDPLITSFPTMCATAFIQGMCIFSFGISSAAFIKGSVSNENFTVASGIFGFMYGVGGSVGSLLSGLIKDKTGSYTAVFLTLGAINCLIVILTFAFLIARRRWAVVRK
ncbi:monocarboxylate transporter 2-like isoform X1 [Lytechinus pictus]|uniref:monocarboxylate transporter 2-like isoform X1 n=1 Tax=Lytechinus pictus TaxID=7653 RepID=UPI0030B9E700